MTKTVSFIVAAALAVAATGFRDTGRATVTRAGDDLGNSAAVTSTVTGTSKLDGPAPHPKPINMAVEPACSKQHPTAVTAEDLMVDSRGGLANVLVYISEELTGQQAETPKVPVIIDQKGCMYRPHLLALQANQKIRFVNSDPTTHNIHPMPRNNLEWNKAQLPGASFEEAFAREEIAIPVKCNVHPWMKGYIAVLKHPYFAITDRHGSFEIKNVPPGTYTIQAWHEKLGTTKQTVTVGGNESKNVQFIFKSTVAQK